MSRKRSIKIIGVIVAVFFMMWYFSARVFSLHGNRIEKVTVGGDVFYAEIVSSNAKLQKGLGERNYLCDSCAMLFKFSNPGRYSFWMKDMRFPLDIIWIREGKIVHIEKNVAKDFSGILYPENDSDSVLEINAGIADKSEIKEGDNVN